MLVEWPCLSVFAGSPQDQSIVSCVGISFISSLLSRIQLHWSNIGDRRSNLSLENMLPSERYHVPSCKIAGPSKLAVTMSNVSKSISSDTLGSAFETKASGISDSFDACDDGREAHLKYSFHCSSVQLLDTDGSKIPLRHAEGWDKIVIARE
jgi:hypothetical protein